MGANGSVTIASLRPYLLDCGYAAEFLCADYPFSFDERLSRLLTADLAAFAHDPKDARSACLGIIESKGGDPVEAVESYYRLGAPVVFVCNGSLQRWRQRPSGPPEWVETVSAAELPTFFARNREKLGPREIYRSKTLGRLRPDSAQLDFVDVGLLPAVEGEVSKRLARRVEAAVTDLSRVFGRPIKELGRPERRWVLEGTFYLLAAKLLKDKAVEGFAGLRLDDMDAVFREVNRHYGATHPATIGDDHQRAALLAAAEQFEKFRYLGHVTTDILADVYEEALVDPAARKAFGTHSTPSYIVDWVVWQLLPWIEQIDREDRHVFEPASGHAPFLVSAMRLLRFLLPDGTKREQSHKYLKDHLHGLEKDDRAREVARLSLTLADVPNPNGWDLSSADMFHPGVLETAAAKAKILLCNPPFEELTQEEGEEYADRGAPALHPGKAAELLQRTLPHLPEGAVFGVVLPQGILQSTTQKAVELRQMMLRNFQLSDICLLNDRFFRYADHETALVLGRKTKSRLLLANRFTCRKVREEQTKGFARSYETTSTFDVAQADVSESPDARLWLPDLPEVWKWCRGLPKLCSIAEVERGLNFRGKKELPEGAFTYGKKAPPEPHGLQLVEGFAETSRESRIDRPPELFQMNLAEDVVGVRRGGAAAGRPQVILNYIRISRGLWRWKGHLDPVGRPFESCFLGVRPTPKDLPLEYLWAVLNGPLANAFLYCHTMKRQNLKGLAEQIPVPRASPSGVRRVVEHAEAYLAEAHKALPEESPRGSLFPGDGAEQECLDRSAVRSLLLRLDAEVLRLYALPAPVERALLDAFRGRRRPGMPPGVIFNHYYPDRFTQAVPLHMYLSTAYTNRRVASGAAYMTDKERVRLNELISLSLRRPLRSEEERELDFLRLATGADAYVTAGSSLAERVAAIEATGRKADQKVARLANEEISRELRGGKRGRQA